MIPADELLQHCRTVPTRIALLVGHKLLKVHLSGILYLLYQVVVEAVVIIFSHPFAFTLKTSMRSTKSIL